jgi:hypothetical protein
MSLNSQKCPQTLSQTTSKWLPKLPRMSQNSTKCPKTLQRRTSVINVVDERPNKAGHGIHCAKQAIDKGQKKTWKSTLQLLSDPDQMYYFANCLARLGVQCGALYCAQCLVSLTRD